MDTLKERWVTALRSTKYKQGKFTLRWADDTFCCLGVLADVIDPDAWTPAEGFPQKERCEHYLGVSVLKNVGKIPNELALSLERQAELTAMNDEGESFEVIADWIEENL